MKKNLGKALQLLVIVLLTITFFGLGKWQLDRASQWQDAKAREKKVDSQIYSLSEIAQPADTLTNDQTYKRVRVSGQYIATLRAPGQVDQSGARDEWEVALLQIDTKDAILVVRGLWSQRLREPQLRMADRVDVEGSLQPRQSDDVAPFESGVLQRIDSALVTEIAPELNIYDGFIAATNEIHDGATIERTRVAPPFRSAVTGFYWQHISYVAIWWMMAALMIYLPFYNRRISQGAK